MMATTKGEENLPVVSAAVEDPKVSLSQQYPRNYSLMIVGGVLINIGMMIFSHLGLSAVIKSTICPEGFSGCPDAISTDGLLNACSSNPSDAAILVPGSDALENVPEYMEDIGFECFGQGECIVREIMELHGLSEPCANCYAEQATCSVNNCFSECVSGPQSTACFTCNNRACAPGFDNCTGIDFPRHDGVGRRLKRKSLGANLRILQDDDECFDRDEFELFKVFNLTFVNSVGKALDGGSIALGVMIILASGVWPYAKNILMAYVWFAEMTQTRRDSILRMLAIFGKWSLVDVFAVVIIIDGVVIQKILTGDSPLGVFAESRAGIYVFGIAAIWALAQGEIIRYLEKKRLKQVDSLNEKQISMRPLTAEEDFSFRKLKAVMGISSILSMAIGVLGILSINLAFEMRGRITDFPGPNEFSFNTIELATSMVDECASYDGHESLEGTYFLTFFFLAMAIVIPIISSFMMLVVALTFQHTKRDSWVVGFTFGLTNFAALDVFWLSMVVLVNQFEGLIDSAVGEGVDAQCGVTPDLKEQGEFCISFRGTLDLGSWMILVSSIFFWISQFTAGRIMAKCHQFVGPTQE